MFFEGSWLVTFIISMAYQKWKQRKKNKHDEISLLQNVNDQLLGQSRIYVALFSVFQIKQDIQFSFWTIFIFCFFHLLQE